MEIENHKKHSLGRRAFLLFFLRKLKWSVALGLVTAGIWYVSQFLPVDYAPWGYYAAQFMLTATTAVLLGILIFTYLEYRLYTYMFTDEAFVITSGLAMRNEVAALYHQIQNVNIARTPMNRMIGVSEIVILMTGGRDADHNKIILPAVGKAKAKIVQKELLTRARRHVVQTP